MYLIENVSVVVVVVFVVVLSKLQSSNGLLN